MFNVTVNIPALPIVAALATAALIALVGVAVGATLVYRVCVLRRTPVPELKLGLRTTEARVVGGEDDQQPIVNLNRFGKKPAEKA